MPATPATDRPRRVLVVDDDDDYLATTAELLRQCGQEAETACTGQDAIAIALRWVPDLVLLDLAMPGMDGCQTAAALRALPQLRGTLVVAVSGYGPQEQRGLGGAAGFDLHLVKPVMLEQLRQVLALGRPRPRSG